MDEVQVKLRCLEMAVERAKADNPADYRTYVADLAAWFYNQVVSQKPDRQAKASNSKEAKALLE